MNITDKMTKSERNKRVLGESMLAYSQKMTAINKGRFGNEQRTVVPKQSVRLNIPLSTETTLGILSSRLPSPPSRKLAPIKGQNNIHGKLEELHGTEVKLAERELKSVNKLDHRTNFTEMKRKMNSVSPPEIIILRPSRENTRIISPEGNMFSNSIDVDSHQTETRDLSSRESFVSISPFPEHITPSSEDDRLSNSDLNSPKPTLKGKSHRVKDLEVITPRKNKRIHHKSIEKKKKETMKDPSKKRKKEEKNNRTEVMEVFRYSFAVERLLDKPDLSSLSDKDIIHKVEKSTDGLEVRTLGPAVLSNLEMCYNDDRLNASSCGKSTGSPSQASSRSQSRNSTSTAIGLIS